MSESRKKRIIYAVTKLSREFCLKIRDARREQGISQSELSKEVGCKQSALSMFECGDGTKLNDEVIGKLAEKFGIELPTQSQGATSAAVPAFSTSSTTERGFCPNPHCPSNHPYEIDGRPFAKPRRDECDPVFGKFCALCGEILEKRCPNCGARLHEGAVCSFCGQPYIPLE